jgi:alanyl-tRNA synthetase
MMKTDEIRAKFLDFFASKGHKVFPSDSLVPKDDPTVLFTSAGMNQFKPYFLGLRKDITRACSCQKCLRTDDLEKVGKTPAHHTFFEMLGNFSFGDYFKKEAITWAWEFVTRVLKIPAQKIWVSVYKDDKEAYEVWEKVVRFPSEKIVLLGEDKNFWPANALTQGPDGPCGPCSEIFYDWGEDFGCKKPDCSPACDCGRFVEVWNLVFTQYNRTEKDGRPVLEPLPSKNIDTGMGLERVASVLQNVRTNFEIDIFKPIIKEILALCKEKNPDRYHLNAIADHIRAASFAVGDGVYPSNEDRGYVIRKIIRKASWHGYKLGIREEFLYKLVPVVAGVMKSAYPELEKKRENIAQIIKAEEERFLNTLETGLEKIENLIQEVKARGENVIPGEKVFQLYDTFGFPYELTEEIAHQKGLELDHAGFEESLKKQRERSKEKSQLKQEIFTPNEVILTLPETEFIGYEKLTCEEEVLEILDEDLNKSLEGIKKGDSAVLVFKTTPFYGESGGQVGDQGIIYNSGFKGFVKDTKVNEGRILHFIEVQEGSLKKQDKVKLEVDKDKRMDTARNHTATHLLHYALRKVLGEHVEQSGSYVSWDGFRFDFTHFKALTPQELNWVEELVNLCVINNDPVNIKVMPFEEAKKEGVLALFTEKYKEIVRVIEIGDYSKELCGGTHVNSTGQIGLFKIVSESAVASGIRRIEAVTGRKAYSYIKEEEEILEELLMVLKTDKSRATEQLRNLIAKMKEMESQLMKYRLQELDSLAEKLLQESEEIEGVKYLSRKIDDDPKLLGVLVDKLREKGKKQTAVLLFTVKDEKLNLLLGFTPDLVDKGLDARQIIKKISPLIKGGGGGRKDFVQAGGRDYSRIEEVIKTVREEIISNLK